MQNTIFTTKRIYTFTEKMKQQNMDHLRERKMEDGRYGADMEGYTNLG